MIRESDFNGHKVVAERIGQNWNVSISISREDIVGPYEDAKEVYGQWDLIPLPGRFRTHLEAFANAKDFIKCCSGVLTRVGEK